MKGAQAPVLLIPGAVESVGRSADRPPITQGTVSGMQPAGTALGRIACNEGQTEMVCTTVESLESRYTSIGRIEGSNPSPSAAQARSA